MDLKHTRAMVCAATCGELDGVSFSRQARVQPRRPGRVPGCPTSARPPIHVGGRTAYEEKASELADCSGRTSRSSGTWRARSQSRGPRAVSLSGFIPRSNASIPHALPSVVTECCLNERSLGELPDLVNDPGTSWPRRFRAVGLYVAAWTAIALFVCQPVAALQSLRRNARAGRRTPPRRHPSPTGTCAAWWRCRSSSPPGGCCSARGSRLRARGLRASASIAFALTKITICWWLGFVLPWLQPVGFLPLMLGEIHLDIAIYWMSRHPCCRRSSPAG